MSDVMDDVFRSMADSSRRRILSALCQKPRVAGELGRLVGLAPNAVSFHLKWLKSAGLVTQTREGKYLRYRANSDALEQWKKHVLAAFPEIEGETRQPAPHQNTFAQAPEYAAPSPAESESGIGEEDTLPTELL
jgi:DNA-binding transcriptional ArsR family regulator